ncbi:polysaccharide deacetylase family protein [bacterium]|nr:polysaccharide deacetylase family protein [bacterium]
MFPILTYHYLGEATPEVEPRHRGLYVPPEEFRAQLAALSALGMKSLSAEEACDRVESGRSDGRAIWLTFDDGHWDNFEPGLRLLVEAGHGATFFVIAGPSLAGERGFVGLPQMREMIAAGMSIGCHSMTHPRLARLSEPEMRREIIDSKVRLEDALGIAVPTFCYPYGNWNRRVVELVGEAGYRCAVSTIRGNRNAAGERFLLKRAMVQPGRVGIRFRYMLSPVYHWLHQFKNRGKWKPRDP